MVEQHVVYSESQQRRIFGLLQPEKKKQKGMYTNKIDGFPTLHCTFALLSLSFLVPKIDRNCISMHNRHVQIV